MNSGAKTSPTTNYGRDSQPTAGGGTSNADTGTNSTAGANNSAAAGLRAAGATAATNAACISLAR